MSKYLSPWRLTPGMGEEYCCRYVLGEGRLRYVVVLGGGGSPWWQAHYHEWYPSLEDAQLATDQIAISAGYTILTEEQWEKYRLLA